MQQAMPSLVRIMACRFFRAKPLSVPALAYNQLNSGICEISIKIQQVSCTKIDWKISVVRCLPWDIGEIFSEPIIQLLTLGQHIITGGHRSLCGGLQLITIGHQLLYGGLQLISGGLQIITGDQQLLRGGLRLITRGHQGPLLLTWFNFNPSMDK